VFLGDGVRGKFIFHQPTSIQPIQTDMQGTICIPRRNVEHQLGKNSPSYQTIQESMRLKEKDVFLTAKFELQNAYRN